MQSIMVGRMLAFAHLDVRQHAVRIVMIHDFRGSRDRSGRCRVRTYDLRLVRAAL